MEIHKVDLLRKVNGYLTQFMPTAEDILSGIYKTTKTNIDKL